jgi:hypothetical protein
MNRHSSFYKWSWLSNDYFDWVLLASTKMIDFDEFYSAVTIRNNLNNRDLMIVNTEKLENLPLYVSWAYHSPEFMRLLKDLK